MTKIYSRFRPAGVPGFSLPEAGGHPSLGGSFAKWCVDESQHRREAERPGIAAGKMLAVSGWWAYFRAATYLTEP
jgi:hypothetical protein